MTVFDLKALWRTTVISNTTFILVVHVIIVIVYIIIGILLHRKYIITYSYFKKGCHSQWSILEPKGTVGLKQHN